MDSEKLKVCDKIKEINMIGVNNWLECDICGDSHSPTVSLTYEEWRDLGVPTYVNNICDNCTDCVQGGLI